MTRKQNSKRSPHHKQGLPTSAQVLEFIQSSDTPAGKREIAKAFGLKGQEKIALKKLLKDMAEEGLIDGKKTAFHRMGGVPKVTVLRVVDIDEGEPIAEPDNWSPDEKKKAPRITLIEGRRGQGTNVKGMPALKRGDRVLARTEETENGWRAYPMKKLPSRTEGMMGVIELDGSGKAWLAPVDKKVRNSVPVADIGQAEAGQLVLAEQAGRSPRAGVKVVEVYGDPLAPRSFSLIAIAKHGIPNVFPQETLDEAERAAELPLSEEKREDLRDVPILAIDPADARDHDDAIWAQPDPDNPGAWQAIVAIADVSFYVRPGGEVDREARKRGNSVYFPDRVVPMLPEVLSADVCSLKQDEDRAAMACHLRISAEGKVTSWRFTRAIVRLTHNIAYEDAQAKIDSGNAPKELTDLWACWKALAKARAERDPLNLDLPERRVMLDEQGRIADIAVRERLDAHRVVEDFMIAANVAAAKALEAKAAPVVYRVHEQPSREKIIALRDYLGTLDKKLALGQVITPSIFNRFLKDVSDEAEKALLMEAVLRSQTQAYYGPKNAGHFGLALGSYAHFTSPIRRYADLLVHRALISALGLGADPKKDGLSIEDISDMRDTGTHISQTERRAMLAERDSSDRYLAAFMENRIGAEFDAIVSGVARFGMFVKLNETGADGLIPISTLGNEYYTYDEDARTLRGERSGTTFRLGMPVHVRLEEAAPLSGGLRFSLLEGGEMGKAGRKTHRRPSIPKGRRAGKGRKGGKGRR